MIEHLELGRSAYFYRRKKALSATAITALFKKLHDDARNPKRSVFKLVREDAEDCIYSALSFSFERPPAFLAATANKFDRVFGFIALIEQGDYIALFSSGLDVPASFKSEYLGRVDRGRIEAAVATATAKFERISVKTTSLGKQGVRRKTFEAADLENAMPMASAGSFYAQGYSVNRDDGHFSATPSTGRIAQRGDRGDIAYAAAWAVAVIGELAADGAAVAPFIRNFARKMDLESLPRTTTPVLFAADVPTLTEQLLADYPIMRLVRQDPDTEAYIELSHAEIEPILAALEEAFEVTRGKPGPVFRIKRANLRLGTLRPSKSRIALREFHLPEIEGIEIERKEGPLGEDGDRRLLARYIDRENLFTILFSDASVAYLDGQLFRNEAMRDGGAEFLRHLLPVPTLADATSEKGEFALGQTEFTQNSVFRKIIDEIAADDDVLLCDDLGDEWADFVGLNTTSRPPSINFYHGKHGDLSLGASPFHVAVSQAEKNLGRLTLPAPAMDAKYISWAGRYRSKDQVQTDIAKLVRGGPMDQVRARIDEIRLAPDAMRYVYIVTSSLSKEQVKLVFDHLAANPASRPDYYFVQLYWLLTAYFSSCADMGAVGFVICQP